jgi:hypothetical protein
VLHNSFFHRDGSEARKQIQHTPVCCGPNSSEEPRSNAPVQTESKFCEGKCRVQHKQTHARPTAGQPGLLGLALI